MKLTHLILTFSKGTCFPKRQTPTGVIPKQNVGLRSAPLRGPLCMYYMHTCTRVKERGGKVSFPPLKKFLENLSPPFRGLSYPLFSYPHFEFWAYFPPQFEFWHQNPQGKHQNSLKRGGEKFSSPLKILEKIFPRGKLSPPIRPPTCACMPLDTYYLGLLL